MKDSRALATQNRTLVVIDQAFRTCEWKSRILDKTRSKYRGPDEHLVFVDSHRTSL